MSKNQIKHKMDPKMLRMFIILTVVFTGIGLGFGKILGGFLIPTEENPTPVVTLPKETTIPAEAKNKETESTQEVPNEDSSLYIMQLGAFKTYDNLLTLAGELQKLGYNYGVIKVDGKYSVFSHISGSKEVLAPVEEALNSQNLTYFIKRLEVSHDDLRWQYFLKAAKQIPFEMTSEFIQTFTDDEMHIFGYYMTLSTASFEALSNERQKMLLEIYQWLNQ